MTGKVIEFGSHEHCQRLAQMERSVGDVPAPTPDNPCPDVRYTPCEHCNDEMSEHECAVSRGLKEATPDDKLEATLATSVERNAVVKYLRALAAASNNAGYVALHTAAHDIETGAHR